VFLVYDRFLFCFEVVSLFAKIYLHMSYRYKCIDRSEKKYSRTFFCVKKYAEKQLLIKNYVSFTLFMFVYATCHIGIHVYGIFKALEH
jgi:hypothetical protein